jgi:4-hydroxy-tetrahydrodipicolinate synthase
VDDTEQPGLGLLVPESAAALVGLGGTLPALVTPFNADGSLDLGALGALVEWQLQAGVQGLVPCGTTGEAGALQGVERARVIECVARHSPPQTCILAGAGAASTAGSLLLLQQAKDAGATGGRVVTPPYVRPSPAGLLAHYRRLADADILPIVAYNVPSRTGCDLSPGLMGQLGQHPNILGIKEASGDLNRLDEIRALAPHLVVLGGDDLTACAFNLMGGDGVISVVANVAPQPMVEMVAQARAGAGLAARRLHAELRPLMHALFVETNPVPVKAALAYLGHIQPGLRLPLVDLLPAHQTGLQAMLQAMPALHRTATQKGSLLR